MRRMVPGGAGVTSTTSVEPGSGAGAGRNMRPPVRKLVLVLHVLCGVGWMGADIALMVLLVNARMTASAAEVMAGYTAVALIVPVAVPPLCLGVLLTGLLLGWATPWGLVRHWWVFVKLVLAIVMTILVFVALLPAVRSVPELSGIDTADGVRAKLGPAGIQLLFPPVVSFLLLGIATLLSIFKPRGLTPWSRRGQ